MGNHMTVANSAPGVLMYALCVTIAARGILAELSGVYTAKIARGPITSDCPQTHLAHCKSQPTLLAIANRHANAATMHSQTLV